MLRRNTEIDDIEAEQYCLGPLWFSSHSKAAFAARPHENDEKRYGPLLRF
jgi:hypothetical protein